MSSSSTWPRPWLKHYPPGVVWDAHFNGQPVFSILDEAARRFAERPYLDFLDRKFTYREIAQLVDRAAKGFQDLGVKKGVKAGLFLPNCPQFVVCYFAILKAGGTVVNFSPLYSEPELLQQVEDSETDIMVTLDAKTLYPKARAILEKSRLRKLIVGTLSEVLPFPKNVLYSVFRRRDIAAVERDDSHVAFKTLTDNEGDFSPVAITPDDDIAVLQYTGGTTGVPKGAMLTHANLSINVQQAMAWDNAYEEGAERVSGVLPFFHAFAMTGVMLIATTAGAEILLYPRFDLKQVVRDLIAKKVTMAPGVATMFIAINEYPGIEKVDLSHLKRAFSGGAPLPAEVRERFEALSGCPLLEGYGLTECSPIVTSAAYEGANKPGSIGLPVPATDLVIVDKEAPDKILPLGEPGEICVKGPQVMKGYWRRPEATAETIRGGLLHTGDVGYMDEDGFTFIIDRMKDMILVSGFNVFPRYVEEAIYQHPAVQEVTVIGVPDRYKGEAPKAFVVLKDSDEPLTQEELLAFLAKRLGRHEMPREIEFRTELPKTLVGKLSKKELAAESARSAS